MRHAIPPWAPRHRPVWLAVLGCTACGWTALSGCSVTLPSAPAVEVPAAQPTAPTARQVAQIGFGSSARFMRCLPEDCPQPTPKMLALQGRRADPSHLSTRPLSFPAPATNPGALVALHRTPPASAPRQPSAHPARQTQAKPPDQHTVAVLFMPGSARIGPEGRARILAAPAVGATRLTVRGHTDPTGDAASNRRLAQARAQAVAAQLRVVHPQLRQARIEIEVGDACCSAKAQHGTTDHGQQRRVEIVIERQEPDP